MKKVTVEFEVRFKATLEVSDDATEQDVQDAVAEIDIPENDECKYVSDTFDPDMDSLEVKEAALTAEQHDAVTEAMGYLPDDNIIASAVEEHAHEETANLRAALREKETVFHAQGGRGIELAEEIDRLRIALTLRSDRPEES